MALGLSGGSAREREGGRDRIDEEEEEGEKSESEETKKESVLRLGSHQVHVILHLPDLVLLNFFFKSWVHHQCIQCHVSCQLNVIVCTKDEHNF